MKDQISWENVKIENSKNIETLKSKYETGDTDRLLAKLNLQGRLDREDYESLSKQRKLTIPFIKNILQFNSSG